MKSREILEEQIYRVGLVFLVAVGAAIWFFYGAVLPNVEFPPCVVDSLLGVYCPGCGGTRAMYALLHGQLLQSLWYHPLVLYTVVIYGSFMLTHTLEKLTKGKLIRGLRFHNWYLYGAMIVVIVNCILKNLLRFGWNITL